MKTRRTLVEPNVGVSMRHLPDSSESYAEGEEAEPALVLK